MSEVFKAPRNICPNCGIDIDVAREMFPDGWTTCEELQRRRAMVTPTKKLKHCPRCLGGQMSLVYGEWVCIQCGHREEK